MNSFIGTSLFFLGPYRCVQQAISEQDNRKIRLKGLGFSDVAADLAKKWKAAYHNRSALRDELEKGGN